MSPPPQRDLREFTAEELVPREGVPLVVLSRATESDEVVLQPTPSNDPNDPLNWSTWRKALNFTLVFGVSLAVFTAISIQTVFWQQMSVDMNLSFADLNDARSTQTAGLAAGCALFIPFTKKYGRRLTYVISTIVMAAMAWWSAKMTTLTELYLINLITGLAGSTNETIVQMTIADMFFIHQRGTMIAVYMTAVMMGSFLTPIAAGVQAVNQGWRWSYYAVAISLTVLAIVFLFGYEETKYIPITELRPNSSPRDGQLSPSADSDSRQHDDDKKVTESGSAALDLVTSDPSASIAAPAPNSYRQRLRWLTPTPEPLWKLFYFPFFVVFLPHVMFTALQYAAGICWLFVLEAVISIAFSAPPYNFDTAGVGYMNIGPFIGNLIGAFYAGLLSDWSIKRLAKRNGGFYEPEMRLYLLLPPALLMSGGLIMFGATTDRGMHWIFPSIGGAFFAFGLGAIGDAAFTLIIDSYRPLTAEAFVGITFIRNSVSVGVSFGIAPWVKSMGLTNMFIVCGCLSLFISLLFIPLIIWGKRIRLALAPYYVWLLTEQSRINNGAQ